MIFDKKDLSLENGITKEWIITNGIGGYASSTIIGANTRRYHGLFIAPLMPPAQRYLILSKLDESVEFEERKYDLYTNIGKMYISEGYKYLESFNKDILPIFKYQVEDMKISKSICMVYKQNTVQILYKIKNGQSKAKISFAPVMNFRDFHNMNTGHDFTIEQEVKSNKVKILIDNNIEHPIYIKMTEGKYIEHKNDIFYNMFYIEEEKRGFDSEENHIVTGRFEIEIEPEEEKEIAFICSLNKNIDKIEPQSVVNKEVARQKRIYENSSIICSNNQEKTQEEIEDDKLKKTLLTAIDNFIVYRPSFKLHTVIAGYPWFLDWGRDTLISFEGIFLKTKRYEEAREALVTMTKDIKDGLIPNGYSEKDNSPLYNSVDSSLLLFEQIQKYIKYTGNYNFVKKYMYSILKEIITNYEKGITLSENNVYLDEDGLINSGSENTQNTWMDAKNGDFIATPRYGKVVEINSLWYNALMIMIKLNEKFEETENNAKYVELANKCKKSFKEKFYNQRRKCLYDYIGNEQIRPNQLFALSLTYPIIEPTSEIAKNIIQIVEKKLLNNYGLKTLEKGDENYIEIYEGDSFKRDMSYHQGITWPWLLGLYYDSLSNMKDAEKDEKERQKLEEKINKFREKTKKVFKKEINERGCIGSISELYDSRMPYAPKGAIAQAWSVAEIFRIVF